MRRYDRRDLLGKEPQAMRRDIPGHRAKPEVQNQAAHTNLLQFGKLLANRSRRAIDQAMLHRIPGRWRPGTHGPLLVWGIEAAPSVVQVLAHTAEGRHA